ncbi:hypothetical protein [Legionella geestiana]|uniref:hypothetical protein n=1 Tax=Legionella geestiana TaxID=45065 RepID=UPI003CC8219C
MTQKAYCEANGISYGSFVYQHNRMAGNVEGSSVKFVERRQLGQKPAIGGAVVPAV